VDIKEKIELINKLKKEVNATILVHNYQPPEIQDIADFKGDSLELSRKAAEAEADVIVFCGVDFMAETAKILSPDKKVILPVSDATCPMAKMITADGLREFKEKHPGAPVVTYVNTTADVKAESDICCTSSNAVKIVGSLKEKDIVFTPDKNLGHYVSTKSDKNIIPWPGYCPIHESLNVEDVQRAKEAHPGAKLMAHPECRAEVLELADYVASTGQMFDVAENDSSNEFIVGTEIGMVYALKERYPGKEFYPVSRWAICPNMKKMTLDKVIESLKTLSPEIQVPEETIKKASLALMRMLDMS
jgi:quinolinate synthase